MINGIEYLIPNVTSYKSNFTQEEYSVLKSLIGNQIYCLRQHIKKVDGL